ILTGATVTISTGGQNADVLSFNNGSDTETFGADTITASYSNGVPSLAGTATIADYQTALSQVQFAFSGNGEPTRGGADISRGIAWKINDGTATSTDVTTTLTVIHAPPVVTVGAPNVTFNGGGRAVTLDSGIMVSDPDSGGALIGATVTTGLGGQSGDVL